MDPVQQQVDWFLHLMTPDREAWRRHCWHRAKELARTDPTNFAGLPAALTEAMQPKSSESPESTTN